MPPLNKNQCLYGTPSTLQGCNSNFLFIDISLFVGIFLILAFSTMTQCVTGCPIICVFFLDINPGRAACMYWLAKRLFSSNRQKCQQFSTICAGNWETSRVTGRRQHFFCVPALHVLLDWMTQHTFWLESVFYIVHCIHFQSF